MRIGQHVTWKSLAPGSDKVFSGVVRMFEHDSHGYSAIQMDGVEDYVLVRRSRLIIAQPPAKKTAKGGGDSPTSSAALLQEAA